MPYRTYKTRARRMASRPLLDEGPVTFVDLQYPSISSTEVKPQKPSWRPSPDDIFNIRDAYKWGGRFWEMLKYGVGAGSDAMIPMFGKVYAEFVRGYQAVEEAFKAMKAGYESYQYYKAKLDQFRSQFPDTPAPHEDTVSVPVDFVDVPYQVDKDPAQPERYDYGYRYARRRQYYVVPGDGGMQTYPGKRPPGRVFPAVAHKRARIRTKVRFERY